MPCCCDDFPDCNCSGCDDAGAAPCCFKVTFSGSATHPMTDYPTCVNECEDLNGEHYLSADFDSCQWTGSICREQSFRVCDGNTLRLVISSSSPYTATLTFEQVTGPFITVKATWTFDNGDDPFDCTSISGLELALQPGDDGSCDWPDTVALDATDEDHAGCFEVDAQCLGCHPETLEDSPAPAWRNLLLTLSGIVSGEECDQCENLNVAIPLRLVGACQWEFDGSIDHVTNPSGIPWVACGDSDEDCEGDAPCINFVRMLIRDNFGDLVAEVSVGKAREHPSVSGSRLVITYATFRKTLCVGCGESGEAVYDCLVGLDSLTGFTVFVTGAGSDACDWQNATALIETTTRSEICLPRSPECTFCWDYDAPSAFNVTIPDGFSAKDCNNGPPDGCDQFVGTFQLTFAEGSPEQVIGARCIWRYEFDRDDDCRLAPNADPTQDCSNLTCCPISIEMTMFPIIVGAEPKLEVLVEMFSCNARIRWNTILDVFGDPQAGDRLFVLCEDLFDDSANLDFDNQQVFLGLSCVWDGTTQISIQKA